MQILTNCMALNGTTEIEIHFNTQFSFGSKWGFDHTKLTLTSKIYSIKQCSAKNQFNKSL